MKRSAALLAGLLAGCDLLPGPPDGGNTKVPGTYHDARGSPGHRAHLALEGDQQLSCSSCHFIADAGFSAAAVRPCADCHPGQQEHHHPFDGGVPMTCLTCHLFRAQGPGRWGCARCHAEQLEVHQDRCSSCHRPHGSPFTRAADCGQCHDVTVKHGKGEKDSVAGTCMTCHPHHTKAAVAAARCTSCHSAKQQALFPKGHEACSTCHAGHTFTAASAKSCSSCHPSKPVLAPDAHAACTTCHSPHDSRAAPKTCESCHTQIHPKHPFPIAGQTCTGCHPPHAGVTAKTCAECHRFDGPVVHAKSTACSACHKEPHAGKPARAGLCESCHEKQLALVKTNKGHAKCDACHAGLPHVLQPPAPCLSCHPKQAPPQKGHTACDGCHQSHSAQVIKRCTDCHSTPLPGLHAVKKHQQQCESCHRAHVPEPGFGPASCNGCHTSLSKKSHPTPPQQCVSCHLFSGQRR